MRRLIIMMVFRADTQFAPALFSTDARGGQNGDCGAYGIAVTAATTEEVHQVFELCRCLSYNTSVTDDTRLLRRPERFTARTIPRSRLDPTITAQERWVEIEHGPWKILDHINLGELCTVVRLARRLASHPLWFNKLILSLQDNSTCAGALTKGRSSSLAINHLCRQHGAVSIACGTRFILPWVETTRQPSDLYSRL